MNFDTMDFEFEDLESTKVKILMIVCLVIRPSRNYANRLDILKLSRGFI